ncbi:MAG: hypothetical protein ABIG63_21755, partial [Chloroflexota bacterium]
MADARLPTKDRRPPSALCPRYSTLCPLPSVLYPLSSTLCPLPSVLYPLPSTLCPLFLELVSMVNPLTLQIRAKKLGVLIRDARLSA